MKGIFLIEVPSFQKTLACFKLTQNQPGHLLKTTSGLIIVINLKLFPIVKKECTGNLECSQRVEYLKLKVGTSVWYQQKTHNEMNMEFK